MLGDMLLLVFVLLPLPAGSLKLAWSNNTLWPPPGPAVCDKGKLLASAFSCFKADSIPVFARHGLLLGAVREKSLLHFPSGVDVDFDVGYLPDGKAAVINYLSHGGACLTEKGIHVAGFNNRPAADLQSCRAPSEAVQKQMMAGEPMTAQLKSQLESLCTANSEIPGFSVSLAGTVNGHLVKIALHASEFQWDGSTSTYFYDMCCATMFNCADELHHWFAEYGGHLLTPGEKVLKSFPANSFQPLKAVPFVLSRRETSTMIVPNKAETVAEGLYGPNWQQPWNKMSAHEVIQRERPQAYLCD